MKKLTILLCVIVSIFAFSQKKKAAVNATTSNVPDKIVKPDYEVAVSVDKMPEFPGGIGKFREEVSNNINLRKVKGKGIVRSDVKFDITVEGNIDNIEIFGENRSFNTEIEKAIKKSKEKWIPAENGGEKIKYRYRMPIALQLE